MNVLDMFRLDGKTAIVTGGAGRYGKQIVEALGEAGATVFIASRDIAKCQEVAAKFRNHVLTPGGIEDGMTMYKKFRGREPQIDALLRNRGF